MSAGLPSLPCHPPLVWPEPRAQAGQARYDAQPPFEILLRSCDLIAGLIVGASDPTVKWLDGLFHEGRNRRASLVVALFPAGPTREEHLLSLKLLQSQVTAADRFLEIRIVAASRAFSSDFEKPILPPTTLLAHDTSTGKSWLCIGSVANVGKDEVRPASFNAVFQPDDALRDQWRRWFQYVFSCAAPLTPQTVRIPHLVPAQGDPAAAEAWAAFQAQCLKAEADELPAVDAQTGEVTAEPDGTPVKAWDDGATALDPLAQRLQQVYARGSLVTVDETTRIKPLAIPVKATLLGQQSERMVGALTHKQAFTVQVLDEHAAKEIEKCRRITDLMELLTYPLSSGNRWVPDLAKTLLEKELSARNATGITALKTALGGASLADFVARRRQKITDDLNAMYQQLGKGTSVPDEKLTAVLADVENRFRAALHSRLTPRATYNQISPPDLTANAPDENWSQPLRLLLGSAMLLRESVTDPYFARRLAGLSFTEAEFHAAMNIFEDGIGRDVSQRHARDELKALDEIQESQRNPKAKCAAVWNLIAAKTRRPLG